MRSVRGGVALTLSLRYWRRHGLRAVIMYLGLGLGVALLAGMLLVNDSLTRTYAGWERGVLGWTEIEVRATSGDGFELSLLDEVLSTPGVGAAAPVLERRSYLFNGELQAGVNIRGVDPAHEGRLRPFSIAAGRALEPGDTQVALLSYAAAIELDTGTGGDVMLMTPTGGEQLRVVGVYQPLGDDDGVLERAALINLQQAQALFAGGRSAITRVDVATDGSAAPLVESELRQVVGERAQVLTASGGATEAMESSRGLRSILLLAGLLGIVSAGVLIAVYVRTVVDERASDLRLLHTLGLPRKRIQLWLVTELGVVALLAALPALLLAVPIAELVLRNLPTDMLPFASSVAAPRLGHSALTGSFLLALLGAIAAVLVCRWLFVHLFNRVGRWLVGRDGLAHALRLSGHLLLRRVGPSATVAAVLALTVGGLVGVHGASEANRKAVTSWLDGAVNWDMLLASTASTPGSSVTLPQVAVGQVAALPGVEAVSAERQVAVASRGRPVTMIALGGYALDKGNRLSVVQAADLSGSAAWPDLQEGQSVALSVSLANRLNVAVGDRLPLSSLTGDKEFTVVALVDDASRRDEAAYIALDNFAAVWGDHGVDSIAVRLSPGADAVDLAQRVGVEFPEHASKVPLRVTLADAYRADQLAAAADTFRAGRLVVLLAVLVSLIALLSSSLTGAWQAESELAGLRAMGVPKQRLVGVLVLNVALITLLAAAPGMLLGTGLSRRFSDAVAGPYVMPWTWPLDAYASVLALLALTALLAAAALTSHRPTFSLLRKPRR